VLTNAGTCIYAPCRRKGSSVERKHRQPRSRGSKAFAWLLRGVGAAALLEMWLVPVVLVRWLLLGVGISCLCVSLYGIRWIGNLPYTEFGEEEGNFKKWGRERVDAMFDPLQGWHRGD
jgi:hypothetical protein